MDHNDTDSLAPVTAPYVSRVLQNEAARKGLAAAGAGLLVAAITEIFWPSR